MQVGQNPQQLNILAPEVRAKTLPPSPTPKKAAMSKQTVGLALLALAGSATLMATQMMRPTSLVHSDLPMCGLQPSSTWADRPNPPNPLLVSPPTLPKSTLADAPPPPTCDLADAPSAPSQIQTKTSTYLFLENTASAAKAWATETAAPAVTSFVTESIPAGATWVSDTSASALGSASSALKSAGSAVKALAARIFPK